VVNFWRFVKYINLLIGKENMKKLFNPPWYFPSLSKHYERMVWLARNSCVRGIYLRKLVDARLNWVTLGVL